jgi:hypothetical protein
VCQFCSAEMNGSTTCVAVLVRIKAGEFDPVAYGDEPDSEGEQRRCHDCDVLPGGFHHRGCDWEVCPSCRKQLISFRPTPALSVGMWSANHFCEREPIVTLPEIFDGSSVPLLVYRDHDGSWQALDGASVEGRDLVVAWVTDVADVHPSLAACLDLEPGSEAWRDTADGPWQRASFPAPGTDDI